MNHHTHSRRQDGRGRSAVAGTGRLIGLAGLAVLAQVFLAGCEVDSFFDPSKTGYFEFTPTTVPILERIDVIEHEEEIWGQTVSVTPDDLIPSDLSYRMAPGDLISVSVFELFQQGLWTTVSRRVDAGGTFRLPELGDLQAAGLTPQELEDELASRLREYIETPQVQVNVEDGGAFNYTIYGFITSPGVFTLRNPDLRLLDALAMAGGVPPSAQTLYVVRSVPLTDEVIPRFERDRIPTPIPTDPTQQQPVDIEDLIRKLENDGDGNGNGGGVNPGAFSQRGAPPIDIDDLEPVRPSTRRAVDVDTLEPAWPRTPDSFIYVPERDAWMPVRAGAATMAGAGVGAMQNGEELILERIIEIPYERLSKGDSSVNIVVRPRDRIYIEGPPTGVVYIDGEVIRPGVYSLPATGHGLTLSRLIAASGGLGPLAIPTRVDLTRIVGENREATMRLNLAAIRQRTEPDLFLKPNDHIIIGTSWVASPLAVIRNGFRVTYGFGFLLDRNFGNDVFGPPPTDRGF
ncbi:MAG: polysaccharide biosynthesis/export family protein [Planctomycetota bacterium]